jgi:hypothetical protein
MNKIADVLIFDKLISETKGRFVMEKIYHGPIDEAKTLGGGSVMWCVWNTSRKKWGRWHVMYFIVGFDQYWSDPNEFREAAENYKKYGSLSIAV